MLELYDLHSCQVFRCLRLRAHLIHGDEKCGIHDCDALRHDGHEDVMPGTVDE